MRVSRAAARAFRDATAGYDRASVAPHLADCTSLHYPPALDERCPRCRYRIEHGHWEQMKRKGSDD